MWSDYIELRKALPGAMVRRMSPPTNVLSTANRERGPMFLSVKRIYDKPKKADGFRIGVDRLWPRGLSKEKARVDEWLKDIAPSDELRKWFSHDLKKWETFKKRYFEELENKGALVELLMKKIKTGPATSLYGAKEGKCNNALALKEYLETRKNIPGHLKSL